MTHRQNKGKQGERDAANFISSLGLTAVRACQLGVTDGRDVIIKDLPNVFLEVKRDQRVELGTKDLEDALLQAEKKYDTATKEPLEKAPCAVLWRKNFQCWRLTFADDKCGLVTVFRDQDIKANLVMLNGGTNQERTKQ